MNTRKRNRIRLTLILGLVLIGAFSYHSIKWYGLKQKPIVFTEEVEGDVIPSSEAKQVANEYKPTRDYYYKYFIEYTYSAGSFPSINCKADTLDVGLWHKKRRP